MNIYNNNHYEPLTPQTLPFDTYSPQSLSNGKIISPSSNVLMNTQQSYSSNSIKKQSSSSSTLVNLLHQKHLPLIDQSISQEKSKTSIKQTRKSSQKKPVTKRLSTVKDFCFSFINTKIFLFFSKYQIQIKQY